MSDVSPLAEVLGHAWYHFDRIKPLLPTYGHLLVSALFPMYIGAHASLSRPSSAAKPPKKDTENEEYDTDDEDDEGEDQGGPVQKMEGLEPSDALMFPLTAGLTLGTLYFVIKWLEDPAILNKILSFYFSQMGIFFAVAFLKDALLIWRSLLFPKYYRHGGKVWKAKQHERIFTSLEEVRRSPLPGIFGSIPLPSKVLSFLWACRNASYQRLRLKLHIKNVIDVKGLVGLLDLLSAIIALIAVGYFAFVTKPWWLTNFLGFSFCYGALQFMSPSTFWTGTLILGSLFFYDIYFVFFTPMMVTVATKLDVPIKLLFPRPPSPGQEPDAVSLAMLGLGDIVIPGMMVGLALRFDLFLYYFQKGAQKARTEGSSQEIVKPKYQRSTGAWGERFWAPTIASREPELQPPYHDARSFPKTYFKASLVGYVVGMVATLLVMQYSNHAQPALLYLVPGVLSFLWGTALVRGELNVMWHFSDAEEEGDEEENKDKECSEKEDADKKSSTSEQKSLFMRILSGDLKALISGNETAGKEKRNDKAKASDKKSESDKCEEKETQDRLDLIFFSISYPRKPQGQIDSNSEGNKNGESNGTVSIPGVGNRDDEPPVKRRRGTPRKASMQ
ncbi:signal peptide peptidase [Penicillium atrosanguineum]|uniref:Signal peptide peptidase n=1 Tax=Penicillium atrosanguineum TaxID=1132637 RepID=A0A9W9Q0Y3_9EURO|nr:signal peptide peptidase [Penicillium atrosanguineum]KAJ5321555.1 signal peptide peptidase [Penicillium atrosanguineum]